MTKFVKSSNDVSLIDFDRVSRIDYYSHEAFKNSTTTKKNFESKKQDSSLKELFASIDTSKSFVKMSLSRYSTNCSIMSLSFATLIKKIDKIKRKSKRARRNIMKEQLDECNESKLFDSTTLLSVVFMNAIELFQVIRRDQAQIIELYNQKQQLIQYIEILESVDDYKNTIIITRNSIIQRLRLERNNARDAR